MPLGEATLRLLMAPIAPLLAQPGTTELVINRPGEVGVECDGEWTWHALPELDFEHLDALGTLAGVQTHQDFGPARPSCSTVLPQGYRLQIARPPITKVGEISLTIRKRASSFVPTLEFFAATGYFDALDPGVDWVAWFTERVVARKTFLIGGNTGSSKTTFAEALTRAIPLHERILTIEKTAEFAELPHQGWLAQYYGYTGDGVGSEKAAVHLLETALRQRPDRILFGELRSAGEAWAYLRGLKAGHPGGITTIHAGSAEGTVTALATMMRGDLAGATMSDDHLRAEVRDNVDVLVHCASKPYRVTQVVEVER
jgi:type IV secretion system protein VirB11